MTKSRSAFDEYAEECADIVYRSVLADLPDDVRCRLSSVLCPRCVLYQLPATRFVSNSLWRQWWHLLSEVVEIGRALLTGNLQHAAAEAWDVKQSTETLHRILAGRGADVEMARETVVANNQERGYYPCPGCR